MGVDTISAACRIRQIRYIMCKCYELFVKVNTPAQTAIRHQLTRDYSSRIECSFLGILYFQKESQCRLSSHFWFYKILTILTIGGKDRGKERAREKKVRNDERY